MDGWIDRYTHIYIYIYIGEYLDGTGWTNLSWLIFLCLCRWASDLKASKFQPFRKTYELWPWTFQGEAPTWLGALYSFRIPFIDSRRWDKTWMTKKNDWVGWLQCKFGFWGWDGKGKIIKTTSQRAMINVDPCHTAVAPVSERESHYVSSWSWSSGAIHIHKQLPSTALVILSSVTMLPYSNLCWTRTDRGSNPSGHRRSSVKVPLLGWKANTFLWLQSAT